VEISPKVDPKKRWVYWVQLPPMNDKRGFKDPLWNAACQRDFAAHVASEGFKLDPTDQIVEHLGYLLKNQAAPLVDRFLRQVLQQDGALRSQCRVPADGSLAHNADCARRWLRPRLEELAPEALLDQLAGHLVGTLKAR
jgi:hypothetical protein